MVELRIDPEFRDKIPPMPKEDFEGLREDIIRDGYVRDPLVVWKEENILLDGHNRWRIIRENIDLLGNKFKVDYKSFPDRWACIAWICANQLHKHNMNEIQRAKLLQEEYEARKNTSAFKGNQYVTSGGEENLHKQNGHSPKLRMEMMKEHNIGAYEMQNAVEVGRGIDRAAEVDPEFKREVLSGELKAKKSDLAAIRKLDTDEEVKAAVEKIRNPPVKATRGNQASLVPGGFSKEERERRAYIASAAQMLYDTGTDNQYNLDSLICDIEANGNSACSVLKSLIEHWKHLFESDEGRKRIAKAIDDYYWRNIIRLKGEFNL